MLLIKNLVMTCSACPSQWNAETPSGQRLSIRFRWDTLTVHIDGQSFFLKEDVHGDSLSSTMSTEEMLRITGFVLREDDAPAEMPSPAPREPVLLPFDPDQDLTGQLIAAIKLTQGEERLVLEPIEEAKDTPVLPGYRRFYPISHDLHCTHDGVCEWVDTIFVYQRRMAVVAFRDLSRVSMGLILRRLTEAAEVGRE